ncbi:MAG: TolC family protein [Myxococcota bacterium]
MRVFLVLTLICSSILADQISLSEAERLFRENNLEIQAQNLEFQASKELIRHERTWSNPNFAIQESVNPLIDWDKSEINNQFQLSQLFVLGKRKKRVGMAKASAQMAELAIKETERTLKFELRRSFFSLYYLNQNKIFYEKSIASLQQTTLTAEHLFEKRLLLLSEVMRLRALLLILESEYLDLLHELTEEQATFLILIGAKNMSVDSVVPAFDSGLLYQVDLKADTQSLVQKAMSTRPDFQTSQVQVKQEALNLSLQKSIWIPDLTLQASYQQQGNSVPNYFGLQLSFDLPLWNQNRALVKNSQNLLAAKQKREEQFQLSVFRDVQVAIEKAKQSSKLLQRTKLDHIHQYDELVKNMTLNYQRGNVSIIAFADFYESYRDSVVKMNQTLMNCAIAFEELNFVVGSDEINL